MDDAHTLAPRERDTAPLLREIVLTGSRHRRLRRDHVLDVALSPGGRRLLYVGAVLTGSGGVVLAGWPWVGLALLWPPAAWALWWVRSGRAMRDGLQAGQRLEVRGAADGALLLTDATGTLRLELGSVEDVARWRSILFLTTTEAALGHPPSTILLPAEILSTAELEHVLRDPDDTSDPAGASPVGPEPGTDAHHGTRTSLQVTADVEQRLTRTAMRLALGSDDVVGWWLCTAVPVVVAALVGSPEAIAITALMCLGSAVITTIGQVHEAGLTIRARLPLGHCVQLRADAVGYRLERLGRASGVTWSWFDSHRVCEHVVLLRRDRRIPRPTIVVALPIELLDDAALAHLTAALPRRF